MRVRYPSVCALAALLVLAAMGGTTAPSFADESSPRLLSGIVVTSTGLPAVGARVQISALTTSDGPSRQEVPLGSTMTDASGEFVVKGDVPYGEAIVSDGGSIELIVRARNAVEGVITGVQALPPNGSNANWALPEGEDRTLTDVTLTLHNFVTGDLSERPLALGAGADQPASSSEAVAASTSSDLVEPGGKWESYTETTEGTAEKPAGTEIAVPAALTSALAASGACPQGYTMYWFKTGKYRYSYVPVQYVNTGNRSTMTYYFDESNNTNLEITYVRDDKGWSGGLSGSRSEKQGVSFMFNFANNARRVAKLEWKYQRIDQYCVAQGPALYYATGLVRWEPQNVASGSHKRDTSYNFACQAANESDMAATTSVVRSSYVAWGGWFSIAAGFKADLNQRNDSTEKLVFTPDAGQTARMCGSDAKPLEANLVKEVS